MAGARARAHAVSCALMAGPSELSDVAQEVARRSAQEETFDHLRTRTWDGAVQGPGSGRWAWRGLGWLSGSDGEQLDGSFAATCTSR